MRLNLFQNSTQPPTIVMLNLFQHLKEIPKQVRDDNRLRDVGSSKRALLLPLLFSLSTHGVVAGLLVSTSYKVVETEPVMIQVLWEKASTPHPLLRGDLSRYKEEDEERKNHYVTPFDPSTSAPSEPTLRTNGVGRNKKNNIKETALPSVRPERRAPELVEGDRSRRKRSCEAAKSKDRAALNTGQQIKQKGYDKPTQRTPYTPLPSYPWICRKRGQEGQVYLRVKTNKEGRVTDAHLHKSSGYAPLDQAALETVKTWILSQSSCKKVISIAFRLKE